MLTLAYPNIAIAASISFTIFVRANLLISLVRPGSTEVLIFGQQIGDKRSDPKAAPNVGYCKRPAGTDDTDPQVQAFRAAYCTFAPACISLVAIANLPRLNSRPVFFYRKRGDLHNKWDTVIKAAGIKRMKPRSGRHGFATTALKKMDPKTAAWLGGWKNIRLFMETYAHAIQDITLNERMFDTADTELTQRPTRNARKPRKMGTT